MLIKLMKIHLGQEEDKSEHFGVFVVTVSVGTRGLKSGLLLVKSGHMFDLF